MVIMSPMMGYLMIMLGAVFAYFLWLFCSLEWSTRNSESEALSAPTTLVFLTQVAPPHMLRPRRRPQPPPSNDNQVDSPPPASVADEEGASMHEVVITIACEDEETNEDLGGDKNVVVMEDDCCSICLGEFEAEGESGRILVLAACKHRFHDYCIGNWVVDHSTCPLCRKEIKVRREAVSLQIKASVHDSLSSPA